MQKLHPKAVWIFFIRSIWGGLLLFIVIATFVIGLLSRMLKESFSLKLTYLWWFLLILVFYVIFCWIWAKLTYHFWRYQLTEDAFKKEYGVISKKYVSIPYDRIQNVDIYRGIIERIFGLSHITIQTAGYGAIGGESRGFGGEGYLPGLDKNVAEELRDELIRKAKGTKQGL